MRRVTRTEAEAAGAVVLFAIGLGIGAAKPGQQAVTVEKSPTECVTALDLAGKSMDLADQGIKLMTSSMMAVGASDWDTLRSNTEKVKDLATEMDDLTPNLKINVQACRDKG